MEAGVTFAPENAQGYAYIAQGELHTEPAGHVHLYSDVASAGMILGVVPAYESLANASKVVQSVTVRRTRSTAIGKQSLKTWEISPLVLACHYSDRTGGHEEWQQMVDDPVAWGSWRGAPK